MIDWTTSLMSPTTRKNLTTLMTLKIRWKHLMSETMMMGWRPMSRTIQNWRKIDCWKMRKTGWKHCCHCCRN